MTFQFRPVNNIRNQDAVQCETMVSYACPHSVGCLEPISHIKRRWSTNRSSILMAPHQLWAFQQRTSLIDPQYFNCDSAHQCFGDSSQLFHQLFAFQMFHVCLNKFVKSLVNKLVKNRDPKSSCFIRSTWPCDIVHRRSVPRPSTHQMSAQSNLQ